MKESQLEGKIAVVTGASGGIGRLIVERLAEHGAVIAAIDKDKDELVKGIRKMQERGYPITAFPSDVTDPVIVEEVISTVESELGPIDILVNVAGLLKLDLIDNLDVADWDASFSVNATGVFHMSKIVSRQMIPREKGSIITVSSNASHIPRIGMAAYGASKAAATMFTKCLGLELAKHNIRCNVISPGSTDTKMLRKLWSNEEGEIETIDGQSEVYRVGIPLGKIGTPSDIANSVLFFASDDASHITMHDMVVDGGATLGV
ncbi:2,3-dihydro-2,3-dihydroxybenzoate dehydrogenase [Sporosarcina sp. P29]|uniref:2,3-dihydro-2,3-dihydroxybenzoate dehydrogenase n=1 Tax=Sporosarcina sp. P29 TaxID=2048252 RepID=UPI000C167935|nr:2,3-dihydro-2,3-dihydroxybenzoate dehydrogenase [Sporosarcina sp. P29]PID00693.1 2,3-dihydro-2,3-dihydroxybenzoate dehydrogenase [Sporosarcina sp. P29]